MLTVIWCILSELLSSTHRAMPPREHFSEREIAMILSAICFFKTEGERLGDKRFPVYEKTKTCLGISLSSVKRIGAASNKENEGFSPPSRKRQCVQQGRPKIWLDDFTLGVIRRTIYDFYLKKMYPTLEILLHELNEKMSDFPSMSKMTLHRTVKKLGFRFRKFNRKPVLMESTSIAASRHAFLRKIKELRSAGYKLFFTDETWCGQNHTLKSGWQEQLIDYLTRDFTNYDQYRMHIQQIYGWRGGFKTPTGAGKRVIILHIGSEEGFLQGAELCFVGKKGTNDYHNEMNSAHFTEWFRKVLGLLPPRSAVIIDQAPYHTMLDPLTRNPTISWKKDQIISWLQTNNIQLPPNVSEYQNLTKAELIILARPYFKKTQKLLAVIAKEMRPDVELLWLPVAHCELNPIELIWAYVKGKISRVNLANANDKGRSMDVLVELCKDSLRSVTPELWKKCIKHTEKIEQHYWESDQLNEDLPEVEPMVISVTTDSEISEESDYSGEENEEF